MKIVLTVLMLLAPTVASATNDEPPALRNNPFARPPSEVIVSATSPITAEPVSNEPLELQATMIGTVSKLANVGGKVLKPGDKIQGYVLVEIHERYAVFERNGKQTTVYVKPLQVEDDV